MPEFDALDIGGMTATVQEARGRGEQLKYILQWTSESTAALPDDFRKRCVDAQLSPELVCLPARSVERVDGD